MQFFYSLLRKKQAEREFETFTGVEKEIDLAIYFCGNKKSFWFIQLRYFKNECIRKKIKLDQKDLHIHFLVNAIDFKKAKKKCFKIKKGHGLQFIKFKSY